ncbi:hypothetical protein MRB53_038702 [Persea americana]|nr:hypothetical protein MRB53_038702 [Persea americana]
MLSRRLRSGLGYCRPRGVVWSGRRPSVLRDHQYRGLSCSWSVFQSYETTKICPAPTCPCQDMPPGLDIDRNAKLAGTMAAHAEHLLISTGRTNWPSKIEDDEKLPLVRVLKQAQKDAGKADNVRPTIYHHTAAI